MADKRKRKTSSKVPVKRRKNLQMRDTGNINFDEQKDANIYASAREAGHKVDKRAQKIFIMIVVLLTVFFIGLVIPKDMLNSALHNTGYAGGYTFSWFVDSLQENVNGLVALVTGNDTGPVPFSNTVFRYVVICFAGAGLALCGAVYQGAFRNPLVSPSTLGVMSGASLGMIIWVVFFISDEGSSDIGWVNTLIGSSSSASSTASSSATSTAQDLLSTYGLSLLSFVGCAIVVVLVLFTMRALGRFTRSNLMIIIVGQMLGGVCGAIVNTVRYYYVALDPYSVKSQLLTQLQIASFYRNYGWLDVITLLVALSACAAVVLVWRRRMMLLSLGEEEARALGVETRRMQIIVVAVCTLLTAIIVSFAGTIGFIGFLIPHLSRRLVGADFGYLLPAAMVLGAIFVLVAYVLVSAILGPDYESMSGMYISIGGAVVFLVTALRNRGGQTNGF